MTAVLQPIATIVAAVVQGGGEGAEPLPRRDPALDARSCMHAFDRRYEELLRDPDSGDAEGRLFRKVVGALVRGEPVTLARLLVALREIEFLPICVYHWSGAHAAVVLQPLVLAEDTSTATETPALVAVVDMTVAALPTPTCVLVSLETATAPDLPLWTPALDRRAAVVISRLRFFAWVRSDAHRRAPSVATHQIALETLLTDSV